MFRFKKLVYYIFCPIPHPSGDVPKRGSASILLLTYSPPKWGCSGKKILPDYDKVLFPTQVGMFRLLD